MKSLYYLSNTQGIKVFLYNNVLLGTTTGYSLRPNGTKESIGAIQIEKNSSGETLWLSGYGNLVFLNGWTSQNCEKVIQIHYDGSNPQEEDGNSLYSLKA